MQSPDHRDPPDVSPGRQLAVIILLLLWCFALRAPAFLPSVIDWDESIYLLIADDLRGGQLPYSGLWDHKPFGLYLLFSVALEVFGRHVASIRALAVLFVFVSACVLRRIVLIATNQPRVANLVAFVYPAYTILWRGTAANAEHFFIAANLIGVLLLLRVHSERPEGGRRWIALLGAGLSFGIGVQIKYLAALEGAFFLIAFVYSQWLANPIRRTRLLAESVAMGFAAAAPTLGIAGFFALRGEWRSFVDANFLANLRHAGSPSDDALVYWFSSAVSWLQATAPLLGIAFTAIVMRIRRRERPILTIHESIALGWVVVCLLEVSATARFYRHYYLVTLPPVFLFAAMTGKRFVRSLHGMLGTALVACALVVAPVTAVSAKHYFAWVSEWITGAQDEPTRIASRLAEILSPNERIYVVDYQPIVYFLVHSAPPTRYAFPPFLMDPHFSHVASVDYRSEIMRIARLNPRCLVLLNHGGERAREVRDLFGPKYAPAGSFDTAQVLCRSEDKPESRPSS